MLKARSIAEQDDKMKFQSFAINEYIFGDIDKLNVFLKRSEAEAAVATIDDLENSMVLVLMSPQKLEEIIQRLEANLIISGQPRLLANVSLSSIDYRLQGDVYWTSEVPVHIQFWYNSIILQMLKLVDGVRPTKDIFETTRVLMEIPFDDADLLKLFKPVYLAFELFDLILLRDFRK